MRPDVHRQDAVRRQQLAHRDDDVVRREGLGRRRERGGKTPPMIGQRREVPRVAGGLDGGQVRERRADVADDVARERVRRRQVARHGVDVDDRHALRDPVLVVELHGVVAHADHQVGRPAEVGDHRAPRAADDADERAALVRHVTLRHHRGHDRQPVAFDELPQRGRRIRAVHRQADGHEREAGRAQRGFGPVATIRPTPPDRAGRLASRRHPRRPPPLPLPCPRGSPGERVPAARPSTRRWRAGPSAAPSPSPVRSSTSSAARTAPGGRSASERCGSATSGPSSR